MLKRRRRRRRVGIILLSMMAVGSGLGCQAGPPTRASLFDECSRPTPTNEAWCLSVRYPSVE